MKYFFLLILTLISASTNAEEITPDYISHSYTETVSIDKIDKVTQIVEHHYTILKPGSDVQNLFIHYGYLKDVKSISAEVYDSNGKLVKKFKKGDITDHSAISSFSIYEESRIKYLKFTNTHYPYTVKYRYEIEHQTCKWLPVFAPLKFDHKIEKASFTIINNTDIALNSKIVNEHFFTEIEEKGNIYSYTIEDPEIIAYEKDLPNNDNILPYIIFSVDKFKLGKFTVDNSSWTSLGNFYYELNDHKDGLSPEMKNQILELIANCKTEEEKVNTIYQFIQKDLRYVSVQLGIGGWKSYSPKYVEERKYGDCKAMSCYLKACLEVAEIPAHMMIIKSSRQADLVSEDLVAPYFNHAILYVPSLNVWLDPTQEYAPSGYIGSTMSNKIAIMLAKDTSKIIYSPDLEKIIHSNKVKLISDLSEKAASKFKVEENSFGIYDESARSSFAAMNNTELEESIYEFTELQISALDSIEYQYSKTVPSSTLSYQYTTESFPQYSGNRIFIPLFVDYQFQESNIFEKSEERKLPFSIPYNETISFENTIKLPEGYELEYLPESIEKESEFGKYECIVTHKENKIHIKRDISYKKGTFPKEQYQEAYQFFQDLEKNEREEMVLVKKK